MKLLIVKFDEAVDTSSLPVGTEVTIGGLTGIVMATTHMEEPPEPKLVPHTHPAEVVIGPAGE